MSATANNVATTFDQQLAYYRDATYQALRAFLPAREPKTYLYDLIAGQLSRAGKGLRPALCIATCLAHGGELEQALPSAVAIELLHNSFLVHDDVEDGSEYRRNHPTMHVEHGLPLAINVGDGMNTLSIGSLIENIPVLGPDLAYRIFHEVHHLVLQSVEGQALELGWTRDNRFDLGEADYLRMVLKKTCWYTCIHPCRIGALIGTRGAIDADRFNLFGYYMGAAFQIQDDVLNLIGDQAEYGKEILGDIWEGKRTLMLVHALRQCGADERERLGRILSVSRDERNEADVRWVFDLFQRHGSIDFARESLREIAQAALREFEVAYRDAPSSPHKEFVRGLVAFVSDRRL
jgi:geranylgeranyl diphosphate synthase type II